ncbi:MAG: hypothetical protein L7F78_12370 [Syntrophales bacterium LBB04]|nr:hypothetical protein [Syntrophales bacterium LBB04]
MMGGTTGQRRQGSPSSRMSPEVPSSRMVLVHQDDPAGISDILQIVGDVNNGNPFGVELPDYTQNLCLPA